MKAQKDDYNDNAAATNIIEYISLTKYTIIIKIEKIMRPYVIKIEISLQT